MKEKEKKVIIIGHRGANSVAPENTLKSFQKAIDLDADYIEFDIHQSKDGEIVVMHDSNTFATTGHKGSINRMTIEELKRLDCGDGEQIPTLRETIELAKGKIGLLCDIKASGLTKKLVNILKEEELIQTSLISSFIFNELLKIQKLESNLKLGLLLSEELRIPRIIKRMVQKAINNDFYSIHLFYEIIEKKIIEIAHNNNLKVIAWTVDNEEIMKKLINLGVDGLITNDIAKAKSVLSQI